MNKIIDFENYRSRQGKVLSRVFTGRDRGEIVRKESNIDALFKECEHITIIIPKDIYSITPSFLEEFFVNIINNYGISGFEEKISIEDNGYEIGTPLSEAFARILQKKTGLDK